jgi:RNA polymerase sigma factor (sigma-70 family)
MSRETELPQSGLPDDERKTTARLLARVRQGDRIAREELAARYLPVLRRWARGRVPRGDRSLADTDDLVQVTLIKALNRVEGFEPRREGAFLAYLTTILRNQIVDRPGNGPAPLEEVIGRETLEIYERALGRLGDLQREALVLRLELGWSYREVADAIGSPSANAARMVVTRALARMAELMVEFEVKE